ncbi:hypothetical protein Q8G35_11615 [Peribacillus simplex]|uniref:Uncharacterized protein n=2 Tax=Peribacillus TaxID=2675229 RepID=A0AA90T127_9BACI|nr:MULTISPECIES: hypothetical protein [Peribacillus]MDP1419061.1 hypothetical protein [Peribacillus simplex]MDP1451754.1 hypothetical protein [Peribacillus frigoritolerans]
MAVARYFMMAANGNDPIALDGGPLVLAGVLTIQLDFRSALSKGKAKKYRRIRGDYWVGQVQIPKKTTLVLLIAIPYKLV